MSRVGRGIGQAATMTARTIGSVANTVNNAKRIGTQWLDAHPAAKELGTIGLRIAEDTVPGLKGVEDVLRTADAGLQTANRIVGNQSSGGFSNQQIGNFASGALKRAGGPLADQGLGGFVERQAQRLPGDSVGYKVPKLNLNF